MSKPRLTIPDDLDELIDRAAARLGISQSAFLLQAARLYADVVLGAGGGPNLDQPRSELGPPAVPLKALDEQSYVNRLLRPHDDDTVISMIHQLWQLEQRPCPNDEIRDAHADEAFELKRLIALRRKQVVDSKGLTGGPA